MRFSNSNVQFPPLDCNGYVIGQRTQSDWVADGNRSGGERNLIGWRTETDRVAGVFKGVHLSQVHQQSYQVPNKTVKCTNFLSVVNILAWMVHLRQVHPLKEPLARLVQFLLGWLVHFLLWQATKPSGDKCTP